MHIMEWKTIYDFPELLKWLDEDKCRENGIDPHKVYMKAPKKLWFRTPNGISYSRYVKGVLKGYREHGLMPHEIRNTCIPGYNDLTITGPEILEYWDWDRNNAIGIDPHNLVKTSGLKAYFKCTNCGKPIEDTRFIFSFYRNHSMFCDKCYKHLKTSFQEQTLFYYISKIFDDAINDDRTLIESNMELDIYIPSHKLAIEYDGGTWHKNRIEHHKLKYRLCMDKGIKLIRVTDFDYDADDCDYKIKVDPNPTDEQYNDVIGFVCDLTKTPKNIIVDVDKDQFEIIKRFKCVIYESSFGYKNPGALKYWDYDRNSGIDPYQISANDTHLYWFRDDGYEPYRKRLCDITQGKNSCLPVEESKYLFGYSAQASVCLLDIQNKKIYLGKTFDIVKITGYTQREVTRLRNGRKPRKTHNSTDGKYIIIDLTDDYISILLNEVKRYGLDIDVERLDVVDMRSERLNKLKSCLS